MINNTNLIINNMNNKTTNRFDDAVTKLYTAYHNNTLDAMDCKHCAVGNLCNNSDAWIGCMLGFGRVGSINRINPSFKNITNYSNQELATIELVFLYGIKDNTKEHVFKNVISNDEVKAGLFSKTEQKELQFKGLCAVIEYLAELDGIENPFNFDKLFNDDKEVSKLELELILI